MPPREVALATLVREGPGENRHITLIGFRPGGYAVETKRGSWTRVWVALFPDGGPDDEIRVVLSTSAVGDEDALVRLLQPGRVTGVCSRTPRSSWGATLGPELVQGNRGCPLSAAWEVEEIREPPSEAEVTAILAGAAACLVAVIVLASLIVWRPD